MISIEPLFDAYSYQLEAVTYDSRGKKMEAHILFTLPIADHSDEMDAIAWGFDDHEDGDWKLEALDIDEGPKVAWYSFLIEARSEEACRFLQAKVAASNFWFETQTTGD